MRLLAIRLFTALIAGCLLSANVLAAPVSYDESIDGDLELWSSGNETTMFLDIGLNTVTGETGKVGTSNDWDGMVLDVASGQLITSISIDYTMDAGDHVHIDRLHDGCRFRSVPLAPL